MGPSSFWRYSPELSEEELYRYERLLYMPREDWDAFRHDSRYNDQRIRDIYHANKGRLVFPEGMSLKTLLPPPDCDCWIEPDNTYTESDPNNWPNCAGGGPGVDCWIGPVNLPFNFCFYGQQMNQVYFTSKGTIAFGNGYYDWTPSEFPQPVNASEPQYDHICGFWADFDFRQSGEFLYKVTSEALYVNYVDVGYYANHEDKLNSFQIIIAAEGNSVLPEGTNVQFCYRDMAWAHGDVGGSSGFGGPTPANVGADRSAGAPHVQFGRFNLSNATYNGPYGQANNQQDGVNWLDNKNFSFSTCNPSSNIPPIATVALPCDTIFLCQGDAYSLNMQFLSPENNQITVVQATQTGTGMSVSTQQGNTASVSGQFVAGPGNIGVNTVTITATDNGLPSGSTTLQFIFLVQDIVPPPISISGELSICAGGETLLTASPGFDSYEWNTGCDDPTCLVENGGTVTVTGTLESCTSAATVTVESSNYFIPELESLNEPIILCPGTTAEICTSDEWASYQWAVYPGYPGEIPAGNPTDQQCLEVSGDQAGHYQVIVEDDQGCDGFNIQIVEIIESFIDESNEANSGAYCDGLEPVTFTGGYSNPADGNLTIYLLSSSALGWQGSNLVVTVTHPDNTVDEYIMTSTTTFTIANAPITVNDQICVEYVSGGTGDANNQVWIFNCSTQGQTVIGPGLTPGTIWCGTSGCTAQPLFGSWSVEGPPGWSLTSTNQYNTVFTPTQYGLYTLCFNDPACGIDHCYELEFTEPPTLSISPGFNVLLCAGESHEVNLNVEDTGNTGIISWSGQGVTASADLLSAQAGPYGDDYVDTQVTATITNGCGSASDVVNVQYQPDVPEPALSDQFLCNGASLVLDPVPTELDNPSLEYDWSPGSADTPELEVTTSGTYSVSVSNACDESETSTAMVTLVPPATLGSTPPSQILECEDDEVMLTVGVPAGYSISWDTGEVTSSVTVTQSGTYCFDVTDIQGCETSTSGCSEVIISEPPFAISGLAEALVLCPNECEVLDLQSSPGTVVSWTTSCAGMEYGQNDPTLEVCSDHVPLECLGESVEIIGTASNACGSSSGSWRVVADACALTIPNIVTPNGDGLNDTFEILGLQNYPGNVLRVFDRWGGLILEEEDYQSDWNPSGLSDGTYFYTLALPFGISTEMEGYITVVR